MIEFDNMRVVGPFLPHFWSENDPRGAVEQANSAYAHGGGWRDFPGFELEHSDDDNRYRLLYAGDPPTRELARAQLRDERIVFFEHDWVAVIQKDGSFRVARLD